MSFDIQCVAEGINYQTYLHNRSFLTIELDMKPVRIKTKKQCYHGRKQRTFYFG